jgi:hypothetical protein
MNRSGRASIGPSYYWLASAPHPCVYRLAIEPIVAADPEVRNFTRLVQTEEHGPMDPEVRTNFRRYHHGRAASEPEGGSTLSFSLSACLSFLALSLLRQARQSLPHPPLLVRWSARLKSSSLFRFGQRWSNIIA